MKNEIKTVYEKLKNREIHPSGKFDGAGRWYAQNSELINVRSPSRAWPYSQMLACRTKKYVAAVVAAYNCKTVEQILAHV